MIIATLISTVAWAIIHAVPTIIVKAFITGNDELIALTTQGMYIFLLALPIIGFQVVAGNYFQSTGKASTAVFLTLLRQVIVLIPLLLVLPPMFGLNGVWMAGPISDTVAAIICGSLLIVEWEKINRNIAASAQIN